jgi:hypothetical protein
MAGIMPATQATDRRADAKVGSRLPELLCQARDVCKRFTGIPCLAVLSLQAAGNRRLPA